MNTLYIGDNRDRVNWGCRATSKALQSIIEASNNSISKIDGKEVASYSFTPCFFPGYLPTNILKKIYNRKSNYFFNKAYQLFSFSRDNDYLEQHIDKSIETFMKIKDYNAHLSDIYTKISECKSIIINGEGDFIFTTPPRRNALFYLFALKLGQILNKKTHLVNAMFSDCPKTGRNKQTIEVALPILKNCELITTRDKTSFDYLKTLGVTQNVKFIPDALFTWYKYFENGVIPPKIGDYIIPFPEEDKYFGKFDFTTSYIVVSGSSKAAWNNKEAINPYCELINELKQLELPIYLVPTCIGDSFLNEVSKLTNVPIVPVNTPIVMGASILANAKIMISGRFHPSILASLGGTPCVFLGSNSHKTKSLQDILEYDDVIEFNAIPNNEEIKQIVKLSRIKLSQGNALREKIINSVKNRSREAQELSELL